MRILAARMNHETNMFSPVPTPLASFEPLWGAEALRFGETSRTAFGAFVTYAKAQHAEPRNASGRDRQSQRSRR